MSIYNYMIVYNYKLDIKCMCCIVDCTAGAVYETAHNNSRAIIIGTDTISCSAGIALIWACDGFVMSS